MRSKLLGSVIGFIAMAMAISVLYIGLVFAQTSTSTPTDNASTGVATPGTTSELANATTSPVGRPDAAQAPPAEQVVSEDKPEFLNRSAVENKFISEFAESKLAVLSDIDTGFSDSGSVPDKTSSQVSDIKIYFHVYNPLRERALLTLNTGIRKGLLSYIRIEGATGYRWEADELVIAYVPLPAGSSGLVTLTATPLISGEPLKIQVNLVLKNEGNATVAVGAVETAFVRAKSPDVLKNFGISRSKDSAAETPAAESSIVTQEVTATSSAPSSPATASSTDQIPAQ